MTLTEFLLARIAEDESEARGASAERLWRMSQGDHTIINDAGFMQRFTPARVLAECEAKRRIVEWHPDYGGYGESCATCAEDAETLTPWPCPTLCAVAAVYADHPDYDEVWRP